MCACAYLPGFWGDETQNGQQRKEDRNRVSPRYDTGSVSSVTNRRLYSPEVNPGLSSLLYNPGQFGRFYNKEKAGRKPPVYACIYSSGARPGALADIAERFSPLIEETSSDTVLIDISGAETIFGPLHIFANKILMEAERVLRLAKQALFETGHGDESSNARTRDAYAPRAELKVNVSISSNPDAAITIARSIDGVTVLEPGRETEFLGTFPLDGLDPVLARVDEIRAREIFEIINLWGLSTFAGLAALPETAVSETLGRDGVELQKLAKGIHNRPLKFIERQPEFHESMLLETPIDLTGQLSFVVTHLMDRLCSRLDSYALAASEVRMTLDLENALSYERHMRFPSPMQKSEWLSRLLMMEVETSPPEAPILAVRIQTIPARPRIEQKGLFDTLAPEPETLELILRRLARLVGSENVGSPEVIDTHRPDSFRVRRFATPKKLRRPGAKSDEAKVRFSLFQIQQLAGFRLFRPPLAAEIRSNSGRFIHLKCRGNRPPGGQIVRQSGPWKSSGNWWSHTERWIREEWDVALSDGSLFRIFCDLATEQWYVEGMYD